MSNSAAHKEQVTAGLPTKSAKIRALHNAGYSRSEIAEFLGIRYQHVRNVLVSDAKIAGAESSLTPDNARLESDGAETVKVRLGPDGRVVVPATFRDRLCLKEGDVLLASLADGEIRLLTLAAAIRKAQAIVRQFIPEGVHLVDELIADRRREAEREETG